MSGDVVLAGEKNFKPELDLLGKPFSVAFLFYFNYLIIYKFVK
jgi:hypothetical protein